MSIGEQRLNSSIDVGAEPHERTPLLHENPDDKASTLELFTEMEMTLQVAILKVCQILLEAKIHLACLADQVLRTLSYGRILTMRIMNLA
jgi:hypothetical protein